MKNVLIAPNSFKGCADSSVAAELFYKYLSENKNLSCKMFPVSDGGDGFLNVCKQLFNVQRMKFEISTPFDESKIDVEAGYESSTKTVYIESALVLGASLIPKEKRKAIKLSSKGMGDLILDLINENNSGRLPIDKIIIGIGGTGTNDLGLGMCSRFNFEMCDHFNNKLDILPEEFHKACKIKWNYNNLPFKIECIIDVENEVIGKSGATYQFGSQKGATRGELAVMELGFTKILNLLYNDRILDQSLKLFGAGGGLSAGCQIFFNAKCVHSTDFIISNLNKKLGNWKPDIVVTGEGSFDEQSLSGKGTATIINYFSKNTDKVFLCSGRVDKSITNRLPSNVVLIQLMDFFNSEEESIQSFETGISKASKIIVEGIDC